MLNKEKFVDDIIECSEIAVQKSSIKVVRCDDIECCDCLFCKGYSCRQEKINWFNKIYEENLLKNGNGLKKDDKILVSDDKYRWEKRYFSHYENGRFYVFDGGGTSWNSNGIVSDWTYAKLPND